MSVQSVERVMKSAETVPLGKEYSQSSPAIGSVGSFDDAWLMLLETLPHQRSGRVLYGLLFKRCFDVVCASILLVVLSPLLLLVAVAVLIDSGRPVIYSHQRVGRYGKPFTMYKFRTMIAERRKGIQPFTGQERRVSHKTRHDPRVTRLGRFLRATSIDELPQFWNVLCGDMSFIGPRPELVDIVRRYAPWQHQRHLVRPGLSGWWQVQGRSDRPMHENTELDIYYVVNQSFLLDVQIVLKTIGALILRSGAF